LNCGYYRDIRREAYEVVEANKEAKTLTNTNCLEDICQGNQDNSRKNV